MGCFRVPTSVDAVVVAVDGGSFEDFQDVHVASFEFDLVADGGNGVVEGIDFELSSDEGGGVTVV